MRILWDMDNVLVDFRSALRKRGLPVDTPDPDEIPGLFAEMDPIPGALEAYRSLVAQGHDLYIVTTAPSNNPSAWTDKLLWVQEHLGDVARKRLFLTHHKDMVEGDVLIDVRRKRGAGAFKGVHIQFGEEGEVEDWASVLGEIDAIS